MRIKRPENENQKQLPVIGKLKCGFKDPERGFPRSVNYFIPTGDYAPLFKDQFGEKPSSLPIVFLYDDAKGQCEESYVYRDKSGSKYAWGDGQIFHVWNGSKYEEFSTEDHPNLMDGVKKKVESRKGWEVSLTLRFLLPSIPVVGRWQLTTKGEESSIPNIVEMFDQVYDSRGTVKFMLFDLNVSFHKSDKPDGSKYPVITLVPNNSPKRIEEVAGDLLGQSRLLNPKE